MMEHCRCYGCMRKKQSHPICEYCGFDERKQNLSHQLPTGSILRGQYLIGKVLGQGGFGITYLAWDLYLDVCVAIKEYYPIQAVTRDAGVSLAVTNCSGGDMERYKESKERFMREARALARFSDLHHIVRVHSFFPENNTVYIVMEYLKGITLKEYLVQHGPMDIQKILTVLTPVMEDLDKVHQMGTVHRDISPDNIMLVSDQEAKLLDFGAVREVQNPDQDKQLTKATEAILKQGFAPLEQYNARGSLGPWTDVYALCATICYCLCGKVPDPAPERAIAEDPNSFFENISFLPVFYRNGIEHGMALKPGDRIASVRELLKEMQTEGSAGEICRSDYTMQNSRKSEFAFGTNIRKKDIRLVTFEPYVDNRTEELFDISESGSGKLKAWLKPYGSGWSLFISGNGHIYTPVDSSFLFANYTSMEAVVFNAPLDTSGTVNMGAMFQWCESLTQLDLSCFQTQNVKNMWFMFGGCKSLRFLDLSRLDTSAVTNMIAMFSECSSLQTLLLQKFDTSRVTGMARMFGGCSTLQSLNLESFSTEQVTDMSWMFSQCSRLQYLNLKHLCLSSVKDASHMFQGCTSMQELVLPRAGFQNCENQDSIFLNCHAQIRYE